MKSISLEQFQSLVSSEGWSHSQRTVWIEEITVEKDILGDLVDIQHTYGFGCVESVLGDIEITYTEGYNYDNNQPDTFTTGTDGQDEVWTVSGVVVIDDYGDEINANALADYLPSAFSEIDYSDLIDGITQITDIDIDEDSDMETFTLEIDNQPSIRFTGIEIASVASSDNNASGSYSGQAGRWTELSLYQTKGGKYVCHQIGRTCWQGERDRFSGKVCETLEEVKEFFGHRWLAKDLYAEAGFDDAVEIE